MTRRRNVGVGGGRSRRELRKQSASPSKNERMRQKGSRPTQRMRVWRRNGERKEYVNSDGTKRKKKRVSVHKSEITFSVIAGNTPAAYPPLRSLSSHATGRRRARSVLSSPSRSAAEVSAPQAAQLRWRTANDPVIARRRCTAVVAAFLALQCNGAVVSGVTAPVVDSCCCQMLMMVTTLGEAATVTRSVDAATCPAAADSIRLAPRSPEASPRVVMTVQSSSQEVIDLSESWPNRYGTAELAAVEVVPIESMNMHSSAG